MPVAENDSRARLHSWLTCARYFGSHPVGGYRYSLLSPAARAIWVRALFPDRVSARDRVSRLDDCVADFLEIAAPELVR